MVILSDPSSRIQSKKLDGTVMWAPLCYAKFVVVELVENTDLSYNTFRSGLSDIFTKSIETDLHLACTHGHFKFVQNFYIQQ